MHEIISILKKANRIALFSHVNPDPDTIGSTLALKLALEKMGKKVSVFCDAENMSDFDFLTSGIYNADELSGFDLFVSVDVSAGNMLGKFEEAFCSFEKTIKIDHHSSGNDFASKQIVVTESACAVLIFDLIKKLKVNIDGEIATCLYFGICGDTGVFRNTNIDSKTFLVCSELLACGADYKKVYREFFDKQTIENVLISSNALLNAKLDADKNYAIMQVSSGDYKKFNATENESLGNLPNVLLNCGYKIAVILKQKDDCIRCSFRSQPEYDVSKIAVTFGGGGHKNASGCSIFESLTKAKDMVEEKIKKYLRGEL